MPRDAAADGGEVIGTAARPASTCLIAVEWDEAKQMRELVSRCPRGPRSGADVGREVLAGEGGAGGEEVVGCALEDDPAAVVAGAGAEVESRLTLA